MYRTHNKYEYRHWFIPTEEDTLDVNFRAIVSDCRGLISGTLTPRPWADISSTWYESDVVNRTNYHEQKSKMESRKPPINTYRRNKMIRVLVANGMEPLAAFTEANRLMRQNDQK